DYKIVEKKKGFHPMVDKSDERPISLIEPSIERSLQKTDETVADNQIESSEDTDSSDHSHSYLSLNDFESEEIEAVITDSDIQSTDSGLSDDCSVSSVMTCALRQPEEEDIRNLLYRGEHNLIDSDDSDDCSMSSVNTCALRQPEEEDIR